MRFQTYGAGEAFILVTQLPVDMSIERAAQVGRRVGYTSTLEKAGKGAKGRVATIGFVERNGKGVYAINITGDRPMLVTPEMPEWATLTTDAALQRFTKTGPAEQRYLTFPSEKEMRDAVTSYAPKKTETKTVSTDKVEQQAPASPWYMHPAVMVGGALAAVGLYLHLTKGNK